MNIQHTIKHFLRLSLVGAYLFFLYGNSASGVTASLEWKTGLLLNSPVADARGMGLEAEFSLFDRASLVTSMSKVEKGVGKDSGQVGYGFEYQTDSVWSEQISIGSRFYASTLPDSMYLGARVASRHTYYEMVLASSRLQAEADIRESAIEAGYRWGWESGLLLRIGAQIFVQNAAEVTGDLDIVGMGLLEERAVAQLSEKLFENQDSTKVVWDIGLGYFF